MPNLQHNPSNREKFSPLGRHEPGASHRSAKGKEFYTTNAPLHFVSGGVVAEETLTAAERRDEQLPVSVRHVAHVGDHPRAGLVVPPAAARSVRPGRVRAAVQPPHLSKTCETYNVNCDFTTCIGGGSYE